MWNMRVELRSIVGEVRAARADVDVVSDGVALGRAVHVGNEALPTVRSRHVPERDRHDF